MNSANTFSTNLPCSRDIMRNILEQEIVLRKSPRFPAFVWQSPLHDIAKRNLPWSRTSLPNYNCFQKNSTLFYVTLSNVRKAFWGWLPVHLHHKFEEKNGPDMDNVITWTRWFFIHHFEEHYVMCRFTCPNSKPVLGGCWHWSRTLVPVLKKNLEQFQFQFHFLKQWNLESSFELGSLKYQNPSLVF